MAKEFNPSDFDTITIFAVEDKKDIYKSEIGGQVKYTQTYINEIVNYYSVILADKIDIPVTGETEAGYKVTIELTSKIEGDLNMEGLLTIDHFNKNKDGEIIYIDAKIATLYDPPINLIKIDYTTDEYDEILVNERLDVLFHGISKEQVDKYFADKGGSEE